MVSNYLAAIFIDMVNITDLSTTAQTIATKLGIFKFDIYGSTVDETSVQVERGASKQVKASNRSGITVRVWNTENTVGTTSTTDIDPIGLELALKTAHEASFFGIKEHAPDFSPESTATVAKVKLAVAEPATVPELVASLITAEKELLAAHEAIESVPYNGLSQRQVEHFYLNSQGANRHETRSLATIYLYTKTEQEGKKPRSAGSFEMSDSFQKLKTADCVAEAAAKTISHLNYQQIPTGKYLVAFAPEAFLSLLGAFSNIFNAQSILDKQSLSTPESLGQLIASPLLSIADDALHPDNIGADTFDGEGTPTRRVTLLDKGVISSFIHSAGTAKRLGATLTGHANMGSKITVSPHFYHVYASGEPAAKTYSLAEAENVILIDDLQALHAGVQSLQGSFSLPFDGWLVNKGNKVSIDAATVAGDFLTLLKQIVYVEPEAELTSGGLCPMVWVEGLSITGE
jgi:PmbA protein